MNSPLTFRLLTVSSAALALALISGRANAQFSLGDVVVYSIGTGASPLGTAAAPVTLVGYKPTGAAGATLALPSTATTSGNRAVTVRGNSTSEGKLRLSADGRFLTFTGYNATTGATEPSAENSTVVNRVVGLLNWATGALNTTTALTDTYSTNSIRGAVSIDGNQFYLSGTGPAVTAGIRYVPSVGSAASIRVSGTAGASGQTSNQTNTRSVDIYAGQLYFTTAGLGGDGPGLYKPNAPLPTAADPGVTSLFLDSASSLYDFVFASPTVVYVADDRVPSGNAGGGIQKWVFDGTVWNKIYTLVSSPTVGIASLAGTVNPNGTITLYAVEQTVQTGTGAAVTTVGNNRLVKITDTINATSSSATFTSFGALAGTNKAYRGIAVINPVIAVNLTLEGVTLPTAQPIPNPTIRVVNENGLNLTYSVPVSQLASFYIGGLAPNSYAVLSSGDRQLAKRNLVNLGTGSQTISQTLLTGETNADSSIDLTDLINLLNVFGASAGDGTYETQKTADTNYDGSVDLTDLINLLNNFGATGDTL